MQLARSPESVGSWAYLTKDDLFEEEEADSIVAVCGHERARLQDVAERLPHLHAVLGLCQAHDQID